MDFYKLLRVGRNANLSEIKASYRKLALEYHPDLNGGDQKKTEMFRTITAAYEKLSNHVQQVSNQSEPDFIKRSSPVSTTPRGFGRRRGGGPPPPGTYNMKAWSEGHFGSAKQYDSQFAATMDRMRTEKVTTATAFMRGMDQNKTFQHSQRMQQREREREGDR